MKQFSSRGFTATFTDDASKLFTKDDITVEAADKTDVLAVKSVEFAADGKSATVTLLKDFTDGVSYNVTAKGVTLSLTAKVGAVASIKINTASAQQNVKTPIEFSLFDAAGIDVTPATDLDAKCSISVDGAYTDASVSNAAKATITMGTIGDKATVTVIYNSGAKDAQDITATQEITCVDAKAVLGTLVFADAGEGKDGHIKVNSKSDCAKFYLGLSDEKVSVEIGGDNNNVYFYAKASDDSAVEYDSYTAEAADDDVVSVSAVKDTGKFAHLNLSGLKAGNTKVNIKATKNGKDTLYTIPVEVYEIGEPVKMTVEAKLPTMTNAYENDYKGEIECHMYDANNREIPGNRRSFEAEVATTKTNKIVADPNQYENNKFDVTAEGADAGSYTVKVTGVDSKSGKTLNRSTTIRVEDILKAVQTAGSSGLKLDYQLEFNKTTIDQNPYTAWEQPDQKTFEVRLKATYGGKFVGYVTNDSGIKIGDGTTPNTDKVVANDDTKLTDVKIGAKMGTTFFAGGSNLMTTSTTTGAFISIGTSEETTFGTVLDSNGVTVYYTGDRNPTLAKTGAYTIECRLTYNNAKKNTSDGNNGAAYKYVPLTKTVTVKNSMVIPTVKVGAKTVDSLTDTDIFEVLTTNVDMNQNDEAVKSFDTSIGLVNEINAANPASAKTTAASADGKKLTVKYVVVEDNYTLGWSDEIGQTWKFYIPINTTFTAR